MLRRLAERCRTKKNLPYSVFDRLSQIHQADIVSNKRLSSALTLAREAQLATKERTPLCFSFSDPNINA